MAPNSVFVIIWSPFLISFQFHVALKAPFVSDFNLSAFFQSFMISLQIFHASHRSSESVQLGDGE